VPTKDVIAEETATLEAKNRFRQRYEEWRDAVQAVQAAEMRAKAVDKFEKLNSDGDIN
jgi:hypothetical protein